MIAGLDMSDWHIWNNFLIHNFGNLHFFQILTKFLNIFSKSRSMWDHPKFMPRMDSCQFIIVAAAKNCSPVGLLLLQLGISAQAKIQVSKQKWQPSHGIPENPQIWSCMPNCFTYIFTDFLICTTFIIKSKDHQGMRVYSLAMRSKWTFFIYIVQRTFYLHCTSQSQ